MNNTVIDTGYVGYSPTRHQYIHPRDRELFKTRKNAQAKCDSENARRRVNADYVVIKVNLVIADEQEGDKHESENQ